MNLKILKSLNKILFLLLCVFSMSCELSTQKEEKDEIGVPDPEIEEGAEFFSENDGTYIFELNDKRYLGGRGRTFWKIAEEGREDKTFLPYSTTIVKASGNIEYGFGVIFDYKEDGIIGLSNMLSVMIKTTGYYAIGKIENGVYTDIEYWTYSKAIKTGLGNSNTIKISYDKENKIYEVKINGNDKEIIRFKDDSGGENIGGARGYVVTTSPQENFPKTSVKVSFKTGE